jgi:DNA polymerase-1
LTECLKRVTAEYNGCDIFWTFKLWVWLRQQYTGSQKKFFKNVEMPETRLIYNMERQGIRIDTDKVRRIHNEHSKARRQAKRRIFELAGESFNINSPKHQLLPVLQRVVSSAIDSTGEEALQSHRGHPLVDALFEYRGHQKLCSTYTIPLYFNAIKDGEHRIRARFNQNTITGRLSSSDPINLQNQPQPVRECFIAAVGSGFINADWSNIELRLPAHFSGEPKFIAELSRADGDLHVCTANFIYRCDIRSLPGEEYDKRRNIAKTCNFLLTNSGTAERLAVELKCSVGEAKEIFRLFWAGYPVLANWLAYEKKQARINGGIGTWFGRWVNIPQLKLSCFQPWKCGKVDQGSGRVINCKNCIVRQEAERSAMSIRVQGTAADMCKMAAIRLWREYGLVPNLKVHDEMNFEERLERIPESVEHVRYVMENVTRLQVPLVADVGVGFNWKEAKKSCTSLSECTKKKCLRHGVKNGPSESVPQAYPVGVQAA